jgi:tRNA (guanine-N7-)-methyltransferase
VEDSIQANLLKSRLPVEHPEFRYPNSRNPYWAKLQEFKGRVFSDHETESNQGRWRSVFRELPQELHVEIGCNAAHVLNEWAARNPKIGYIGIDWKYKPIFRGMEKALKRKLDNVLLFRAHAERLSYMFGPGEIDKLCLFFPDPWPKKSQWKNRFITSARLKEVAGVVKKGGIFHIKTDHAGYFEWMETALREVMNDPEAKDLWEVVQHTRNLHQGHPDPTSLQIPEVTLFERLFIKDGIPINCLILRRR